MAKAVGIDLGTTNSVVAVLEGGEPTVIANAEGARTTPSVVGFSKSGEVLVGEVAKRQAITNPERTVRSVKRHMGDNSWRIDIDGKAYSPQEISARILQKLKRDAEGYLGTDCHPGRHHRPGVLRRRPAHGDQGGRPDRRPRGAAHHQRADGGRPGLRPGQGGGADDPRLRPRRRHLRRLGARDQRGHFPGQVDQWQHPPGRRRLGPAGHRLAGQDVQGHRGRRPVQRQDGPAEAEGSGREGQDRAVGGAGDQHQPALHHGHQRGAQAPRRQTDAGQVPGDDGRPRRGVPRSFRPGHQGRRSQQGQDRPRRPGRAAPPVCRPSRSSSAP